MMFSRIAVATLVILAACGDKEDPETTPPTTDTTTTTEPSTTEPTTTEPTTTEPTTTEPTTTEPTTTEPTTTDTALPLTGDLSGQWTGECNGSIYYTSPDFSSTMTLNIVDDQSGTLTGDGVLVIAYGYGTVYTTSTTVPSSPPDSGGYVTPPGGTGITEPLGTDSGWSSSSSYSDTVNLVFTGTRTANDLELNFGQSYTSSIYDIPDRMQLTWDGYNTLEGTWSFGSSTYVYGVLDCVFTRI